MQIGNFTIWMTDKRAMALGFTHRGRLFGIIPGYVEDAGGELIWASKSDLLNPVEDFLSFIWVNLREIRGEEPYFLFIITGEI